MTDAIARTLDLLGKEVKPAPEPRLKKSEFCERFVARMVKRAGFTHFDDGMSVEDYAKETAPTYFADPDQRADGPEECADADMSYWGEE
ncbi:hypothetical protein OKC48_21025 [Methylorubrum extorquens]|uniref:hypothetical protein n=1 Tax=Methylorubrum extorquens TaxID=408 RepID=UPI002236FC61|nr:hypothetical protein [Methylorubrum extorquens]UYW25731.1 hypothetical protein OKC48_21025 [Methylorubrum extorquens]